MCKHLCKLNCQFTRHEWINKDESNSRQTKLFSWLRLLFSQSCHLSFSLSLNKSDFQTVSSGLNDAVYESSTHHKIVSNLTPATFKTTVTERANNFLSHFSDSFQNVMSCSSATLLLNQFSVAETCFVTNTSKTLFSIAQRPFFFPLSAVSSKQPINVSFLATFASWVSLQNPKKSSSLRIIPLVAQTSDWSQQEEEEGN